MDRGFAISPSSPAPSNWLNHSAAVSLSIVAGVRWTGGSASASAASRALRRSPNGNSR
jgi:hypothetical protein